jgi:hypothetical protein|tara:strand:- start:879 stop:1073 length:195 start_codon:yes stop_codon:yes gene_type:complete
MPKDSSSLCASCVAEELCDIFKSGLGFEEEDLLKICRQALQMHEDKKAFDVKTDPDLWDEDKEK